MPGAGARIDEWLQCPSQCHQRLPNPPAVCQNTNNGVATEVGVSSQSTVGSTGGTIATPSQTAAVRVPAGALSSNLVLTVDVEAVQGAPLEPNLVSDLYTFGPHATTFGTAASVAIHTNGPPATGQDFLIAYLDANNTWQALTDSSYDAASGFVLASTTHFSTFAVVAFGSSGAGCALQTNPAAFCARHHLGCDVLGNVCAAADRVLGGTVTGLNGNVTISDNQGDSVSVANGSFTFPTGFVPGSAYSVSVASQPNAQACFVQAGSGNFAYTDVTNVAIACHPTYALGGTATGLDVGSSLTLVSRQPIGGDHHQWCLLVPLPPCGQQQL